MDDVAISAYMVGYYWTSAYIYTGPFSDSSFRFPRSPAAVYRPAIPNPTLTFNVVCPNSNFRIFVATTVMYGISLVPRCTCVEEDKFGSITSQPLNSAINGNFADYDRTQENPILGWTSQESWKNQVIPVQYVGPATADDQSNNGSM